MQVGFRLADVTLRIERFCSGFGFEAYSSLPMDDDEFDATIERMVSLSLIREYTETTGDKDTLWGPVNTAKDIGGEIGSWHVLHSNVLLHEILVNGGEFEDAERLIGDLIPTLKEMALPDITASSIFAGTCLRGTDGVCS